jgi:hypothetical protein
VKLAKVCGRVAVGTIVFARQTRYWKTLKWMLWRRIAHAKRVTTRQWSEVGAHKGF